MTIEPFGYRPKVAAQMIGVNAGMLYKLLGDGKIKAVKIGRITLVLRDSLKAYLDSLTAAPLRTSEEINRADVERWRRNQSKKTVLHRPRVDADWTGGVDREWDA